MRQNCSPRTVESLSVAAIILAGGLSSRMGQDKALIELDNQPLLDQICTLAQECASPVYVVTPWIEKYQTVIPSGCRLIREQPLSPQDKSPLIGFAQGLAKVEAEWILLLACDLPNLSSSAIKKWYQYLLKAPSETIALLPRHRRGWEPLCGFYRRRCLPLLKTYINAGGKSFQAWLAQHPVQELPLSDRQLLFNCNTPEDLANLRRQRSNTEQQKLRG